MTRQRTAQFGTVTVTVEGPNVALLDGTTSLFAADYGTDGQARAAYAQMCLLIADGHTPAEVAAFARTFAPTVSRDVALLELCEVGA